MKPIDIAVLAVLAAAMILAIIHLHKRKKNGSCSGCCDSCRGCIKKNQKK